MLRTEKHKLTAELVRLQDENSRLNQVLLDLSLSLSLSPSLPPSFPPSLPPSLLHHCLTGLPPLSVPQELKEAREKVFALESQQRLALPQLARGRELEAEVEVLHRELLVLGELYHNQREEALSLLAMGGQKEEWDKLRDSLKQEMQGL